MDYFQTPPLDEQTMALIRMAVHEDVGSGDKTVALAIPQGLSGEGRIVARRPGIISGTYLLPAILREYSAAMKCQVVLPDQTRVEPGHVVARIFGPVRALLSAERVLLNFLGHLSGIATQTRRYVDVVEAAVPEAARRPAICDTRKTTPGFRVLDKYAVRCGGGVNHRMGLYDGVMLKDNHLAALRERLGQGLTLAQLTRNVRRELDPQILLWLEVDTLDQLREEHADPEGGGADIILLDNFSCEMLLEAVAYRNGVSIRRQQVSSLRSDGQGKARRILLEASGGITLENLAEVARTGVDRMSIGALTHSAPVLDLSMEFA